MKDQQDEPIVLADHRDPKVEAWLRRFNIDYTLAELKLEDISIDSEAKQNIRMAEKPDEDLVVRYGVSLENGAKFPAIVVFRVLGKDGTVIYGLIGGWHRCETYKLADRKTIPAYVTQVTDKLVLQVLRRTANLLEGKPLSMVEQIENAAWMVRQGYSIMDASRLMSVNSKRLNDRMLYEQVRERLAGQGIDLGELVIPPSAYPRLSNLRDKHLNRVVLLGHKARLSAERMHELARSVREAKSDEHADEVISEWERNYADAMSRNTTGLVRDPASPLRKMPHVLAQVERQLQLHRPKIAALTPNDIKRLIHALRKAIAEMESTIKQLEEAAVHAANS